MTEPHTSRLCSTAAAMNEAKSGCGVEGARLQLGVILHADEPRVAFELDRLGQEAVGRHAGEADAVLLEPVAVVDVDLVAVAVALGDLGAPP